MITQVEVFITDLGKRNLKIKETTVSDNPLVPLDKLPSYKLTYGSLDIFQEKFDKINETLPKKVELKIMYL